MSMRRSRRPKTQIQYELSEWDGELPKLRKRSNSVDLLDELRRSSRKFHSRSQTAVARFPDHYCGDEYVVSVKNQAPNTTHANSYRYTKEAQIKPCHGWNKSSSTASKGTQCALKGNAKDSFVQCKPSTREMTIQTHKWRPDMVAINKKARGVQCSLETGIGQNEGGTDFDFDGLYAMIEARLQPNACPGSHVPEELMFQISSSMVELLALLQTVRQKTDVVDEKEDITLAAIKKLKLTGGGGGSTGIPEELVELLQKLLDQKMALSAEFLQLVNQLKGEHGQILQTIKSIDIKGDGFEKEYYHTIVTLLQEILMYLRQEETIPEPPSRRELYGGKCRCGKIGQSVTALLSSSSKERPGICQRCVNDQKGHVFLVSLKLPIQVSGTTVNIFGRMIECIENDDDFNMKHMLRELEGNVPAQWESKHYQITYEALFLISLLWMAKSCSYSLAGLVDVTVMLQGMSKEEHRYKLPNYVRLAVESRDKETIKLLFKKMSDNQRIAVINCGAIQTDGSTKCAIFEAARNGDADMFTFLIQNGASLDVKELHRSILHEIAKISGEKSESNKEKDWNKALVSMLGTIFEYAGYWWEKQLLMEAWSGCTEASARSALSYLFSLTDNKGYNALQYAARYASPEIVKKMLHTEPYEFNPDPIEFGYDNGFKGYVVDQIESRLATKDTSVLESMILRDPMDGASVLSIEPFRSMINDKWRRYRFFYGLWFVCYLVYMIIYSTCAMQRPVGKTTLAEMYATRDDYGRLVGEIFLLVCLPLFFFGEVRDGARLGFVVPRPWLRTGLFRITNVIFVITTIAVVILRVTANPNEEIALSLALLIGWLNALEFLGAWKNVGLYVIILHKVFITDIALKFAMVFFISLAGTSTATYIIYQTSPLQPIPEYPNGTFWMTPYTLTKLGMTLFREDYALDAVNSGYAVALYITFIFLFNFMLFGLVIGMFADTYSTKKKSILASWIWNTATYALLMDRRLPGFLCIKYSNQSQGVAWRGVHTKLKYLTKAVRRLEKDGKLYDTLEHVVLLAKEDRPSTVTLKQRDTDTIFSKLLTPRE